MPNSLANHHIDTVIERLSGDGLDFGNYRRDLVCKKVMCRIEVLGLKSPAEYCDYLQIHPDERTEFVSTFLVRFTEFFRDPEEWHFLKREVIPAVLSQTIDGPIRLWCPGCSTGQEVYTLAMVFAELLGKDEFLKRITIFATDVDRGSLKKARSGRYSSAELRGVDPDLLAKYFERGKNGWYTFDSEMNERVRFAYHDLLRSSPYTNIDLVSSRNTLIYFSPKGQSLALQSFYKALKKGGFLLLGRVESPKSTLFERINHQQLFRKITADEPGTGISCRSSKLLLTKHAFEHGPCAQIITDTSGIVLISNEPAREELSIRSTDCGKSLADLPLGEWKSSVVHELKDAVETGGSRSINIAIEKDGVLRRFQVQLTPVPKSSRKFLGVIITFHELIDVPASAIEIPELSTTDASVAD